MDYNQPTGGLAGDPYIGKNIAAGIQGSKVPPHAVEYPQREIVNVITAAGITPSNSDLSQLLEALQTLFPSAGINGSQSFTTHGSFNFTVPAGIHRVFAMLWAAGGGGGGVAASAGPNLSSGAGGGEYRQGWILVSPGNVLPLVVGQGGAGGNSSGSDGADGGNSTLSLPGPVLQIQANGGLHSHGAVSGGSNSAFGAGGTGGSGGSFVVAGAAGGFPVQLSGGNLINGIGGGAWGSGNALFGIGTNGILPGVGGSGSFGNAGTGFGGGNGADGKIVLVW